MSEDELRAERAEAMIRTEWPTVGTAMACAECDWISQRIDICPKCGSGSLYPLGVRSSGVVAAQLSDMVARLDEVLNG